MFNLFSILCLFVVICTIVEAEEKKKLEGTSTCSEFADDDNGKCIAWKHSLTLKDAPVSCFPGDAVVETDSGYLPMSSLKIGDKILAHDKVTGKNIYTPIKAWFHRAPQKETSFVQLITDSGTFEVSPNHNIAISVDTDIDPTGIKYSFAADAMVGDVLVNPYGTTTITSVKEITKTGFYSPFTTHSTLYVGDDQMLFLAHSFASIKNPVYYEGMVHNAFSMALMFNSSINDVDMESSKEYTNPVAAKLQKYFFFMVDKGVRTRTFEWESYNGNIADANTNSNVVPHNLRSNGRKLTWKEANATVITPSAKSGSGGSNNNNNNNNNDDSQDEDDEEDFQILALWMGIMTTLMDDN